MYALAASAAGVEMLALAQPAEARIVYTPADVVITYSYSLDLNNDGVNDFVFTHFSVNYRAEALRVSSAPSGVNLGNAIWGVPWQGNYHSVYAAPLMSGVHVHVGKRRPFYRRLPMVNEDCPGGSGSCTFKGPWVNQQERYLGLKFYIGRTVHYGWARLSLDISSLTATLTGYAYETIPNKPIIAGKTKGPDDEAGIEQPNPASLTAPTPGPATLGMLALGTPGLSFWRREESAGPRTQTN